MCGIAGRVGPSAGERAVVEAMTDSLLHRGPDESGFYVAPGVELGMRRLSIIDVRDGHQPVTDESGDIVVVFNGEIYNFVELRTRLESQGHRFKSRSDSEVIAHLYEQEGKGFLARLRGMFAIAIWDARSRTLLLARDRVGKKPLVYREEPDGGISFASEARALFRPMGIRPTVDLGALNRVLTFGHADAPHSAYSGVTRLAPGSLVEWRGGRLTLDEYWQPDFTSSESWTESEAIERSFAAIDEAVRIRLVSERPIGAFLSGGIDSTIVTALMARHHSGPVATFSIGFEDKSFDESGYARAVAEYLGTDHHEMIVSPDPRELVAAFARSFDEPFADSSALPTLLVSEFARKHVVVALTGDGGDEAFSGYDRYRAIPLLQRVNVVLGSLGPLSAPMEKIASKYGSRRLARLSREFHYAKNIGTRYCDTRSLTSLADREGLWSSDAAAEIGNLGSPETDYLDLWRKVSNRCPDPVATMSEMDIRRYLPGDLLVKVDVASMAHSLEARSPLLDREVLDVASRIPGNLRIHKGQTKYVLREIARQLVPAELVDRPKMGFGVPRASWLRAPLKEMVHDTLTDTVAKNRGWFRQAAINILLKEHDSGLDRDHLIWPLVVIELWAREWIDQG
jgi:asparagine synthase (glutamine-hydrolysing)